MKGEDAMSQDFFTVQPQRTGAHQNTQARLRKAPRKGRFALLSATAIGIAALANFAAAQSASAPVAASSSVKTFSIPAQSLGAAITTLAKQAGIPVSVDAALVAGRTAPAVSGSMTPAQALDRLLAGSGLVAEVNTDLIVVHPGTGAGATTQLPAVQVVASDEATAAQVNPLTTVASKSPLAQREIAQTVNVVTQQQIQAQNLNTVADILNRTPGVTVINQADTQKLGAAVYSRGWQITNYNIDGVPSTISYLPLASSAIYDRVEVLHGAAGLYNGLGGAGGTINVVHKQPGKEYAFDGTVGVGTNDTYLGQMDVTGPLNEAGTLRGRAVASWQRLGRDNSTYDKNGTFYGILEADIAPRTTAQLGASYDAATGRPDVGFPSANNGTLYRPSRDEYGYPSWARYTNDEKTVFGNITHRLQNDWTLKLASTYSDTHSLNHDAFPAGSLNPTTETFPGWLQYTPMTLKQQAFDVYADGPVSLFQRQHHLTVGANYSKVDSITDMTESWDPVTGELGSFDPPSSALRSGGIYGDKQRQVSKNYGIYANARISLADPLTLTLGGRLSWFSANSSDDYNYNGDESTTSSSYRYGHKATPFAGLIYDINSTYSAYISYSKIFAPQNVTDKDGNILKPLEGVQYEAGVKGTYLNGRLNSNVAIFRGTQKNRIAADPEARGFYVTAGSARVQGIETQLSGKVLPNLTVSGGYTYLNTRIFDNNDAATQFGEYAPKHMFKLWADYRLPGQFNDWNIGGGVTAVSSTSFTSTPVTRAGGYALFDASVGYRWSPNVRYAINVNNLFNRYYYADIAPGSNHLGQGRNAMLTARISY